jgi:hypothetical protein
VWLRLGRADEQTLTDALDNSDGDALYRRQYAQAEAEEKRRCAAEREAQRPVCKRCGRKFTDQRWEETTRIGRPGVPGTCRCAALVMPTTSPGRKLPPKPPGARLPHRRSRRTTARSRASPDAVCSAGGLEPGKLPPTGACPGRAVGAGLETAR